MLGTWKATYISRKDWILCNLFSWINNNLKWRKNVCGGAQCPLWGRGRYELWLRTAGLAEGLVTITVLYLTQCLEVTWLSLKINHCMHNLIQNQVVYCTTLRHCIQKNLLESLLKMNFPRPCLSRSKEGPRMWTVNKFFLQTVLYISTWETISQTLLEQYHLHKPSAVMKIFYTCTVQY